MRQRTGSPLARASFLGLWVLAAGGVLPFVVLLRYAHPALDDFSYAQQYRALGFGAAQVQLYLGWTGRYVSSALLGIANPLSYNWPTGQGLGGAGVLLLWWSALLLLGRELLRPVVGWAEAALGATLVLALSLAQLPSPAEGLYWLAGAYTYLVPTALTLLLPAVLLRGIRAAPQRRWVWHLLAAGLVLSVLGGNEINGLLLLAALAAAVLLGGPARRLWPLVAVAALGAGIAWGAPGNAVRLHLMPERLPLWRVGANSVGAAAYCLQAWLGSGVLPLASLLLAGWLHRRQQQAGALVLPQFMRRPWVLTALLLGLLVISFVPTYWAAGMPMPRRARNADYSLFVVGWLLVVYSWVAWYEQRHPVRTWPRPLVVAAWGWLGLALATDHNLSLRHDRVGAGLSPLAQAYRDWLSGDAARYDQQQRARYAQARAAPAGAPLRLASLYPVPPTLFYADISSDPRLWGNAVFAAYFHRPAVYVVPETRHPQP